jgi:hypothetical protein
MAAEVPCALASKSPLQKEAIGFIGTPKFQRSAPPSPRADLVASQITSLHATCVSSWVAGRYLSSKSTTLDFQRQQRTCVGLRGEQNGGKPGPSVPAPWNGVPSVCTGVCNTDVPEIFHSLELDVNADLWYTCCLASAQLDSFVFCCVRFPTLLRREHRDQRLGILFRVGQRREDTPSEMSRALTQGYAFLCFCPISSF